MRVFSWFIPLPERSQGSHLMRASA